ncbi:conserved hypothetical protein [Neospora caninum Liverpool]|uniref:Transmembrane protein n=1 Tax=Neospora caninum (strain Liverpool) TaxID=572307 RepID=F0VGW1_NEOCL|nr:conserved hypothetical protein [Neospora caninum Liverpool]CBZ52955.1 conserved hypothetical protein [Neospora caninum Liverpool]CEL66940.1 TPA: hypothetical protein BN1204_027440 [Neospora caninum Liverpool]|eukprot:XP_003882987.1 conserved hypothetical protein [Neospora caninum Liverpool]
MLQLYKNQVVTAVAKRQVEIRKLELDWYTNNYWTLSQQGALLAGFSFSLITASLPRDTSFFLESVYLLLASLALGLQMCVVVTTTLCCMWGPGLALRGPDGIRSVHTAVDNLKSEHSYVFAFFFLGLLSFYLSNLTLVWCFFEEWIAISASLLLAFFLILIFYYTISLTCKLRVADPDAVEGKIAALSAYEDIADLDETVTCAPASPEGDLRALSFLRVDEVRRFPVSAAEPAGLPGVARGTALLPEPAGAAGVRVGREAQTADLRLPEVTQATPQGFLAALDEIFEF